MKPIEFPEQDVIIAKDQPEYIPLPAHIDYEHGAVTFCWKLSLRERIKLLLDGRLWHTVLTFRQPLQPQLLSVDKPVLK